MARLSELLGETGRGPRPACGPEAGWHVDAGCGDVELIEQIETGRPLWGGRPRPALCLSRPELSALPNASATAHLKLSLPMKPGTRSTPSPLARLTPPLGPTSAESRRRALPLSRGGSRSTPWGGRQSCSCALRMPPRGIAPCFPKAIRVPAANPGRKNNLRSVGKKFKGEIFACTATDRGFHKYRPTSDSAWPVRLSVRTPGFQPGKRGSIPLRAATGATIVALVFFPGFPLLRAARHLEHPEPKVQVARSSIG